MEEVNTLIIGASVSGLAAAAALQQKGCEYLLIEKQDQIAIPWRNHYDRLHLHTPKNLSALPYKKWDDQWPRYPSRLNVIKYLEEYRQEFNIYPRFQTEARSITIEKDYWITETNGTTIRSKNIILATGLYASPKYVELKGMRSFPGPILHSSEFKTGTQFSKQQVLVIGFGNSAGEIAIDLFEQGAFPAMSVRSSVNIIPRDLFGIPILRIGLMLSHLPVRVADAIAEPFVQLAIGDINKLGLKKLPYGPIEQIKNFGTIPVLDIGTVRHIRQKHIAIYGEIDFIRNESVHFKNGEILDCDAMIMATGYETDYAKLFHRDQAERIGHCINRNQFFAGDGLYICGFSVSATGMFRQISIDAKKIAAHVARAENKSL